jgi:hypothetical protein
MADPFHTCRVYHASRQMALASLLLSPLSLGYLPCLSLSVPVIDLDPQCRQHSQNWCSACHSKFRFCGVRLGIDVHRALVLRGESNSDTSASRGKKHAYGKTYCCILRVIVVLSTPESGQHVIASLLSKRSWKLSTSVIRSNGAQSCLSVCLHYKISWVVLFACSFCLAVTISYS